MIYRIYPNKDNTIYEKDNLKLQNTGKDQILEVGKFYGDDNITFVGNSRILLGFDLTPISSSVADGTITSPQYRLKLENIESSELQDDFDLFVYPLKESWNEGLGQFGDSPKSEHASNWVFRISGYKWDVDNSTEGKALNVDTLSSLNAYYNFAGSVGNFELVDKIKGTNGDDPLLFVSGGRVIMSASDFSGGTANLSSSLDSGSVYNIQFDFNRESLTGVDFNVINPSGSRLNADIVGFQESLISTATYKMAFTASMPGVHKLQFTYFDEDGSDGSEGNIDNFFLYTTTDPYTLVFDQFASNLTDLPSTYIINEGIENLDGITGSAEVLNNTLTMTSSKFGGATLNRKFTLQENANYTASFDIVPGNFPDTRGDGSPFGIVFTVQTPTGRLVDINDFTGYTRYITSSMTQTIIFQARESGQHLFRWSYYASGSDLQASASLDNILIKSFDHDTTSARFNDNKYDAHFSKTSGGGTWFTSSFGSGKHYYQSFNRNTDNIDVEVTDYVPEWIDGTRTNNGFIIKKSKTDENSTINFGKIKFFSTDTHISTCLRSKVGRLIIRYRVVRQLSGDDLILYVKNLQTEYKESSKGKIRVFGRERYPNRVSLQVH